MNEPRRRLASRQGVLRGGEREVGVVVLTHPPSDDTAGDKVEDDGQVGPTRQGPDGRDIRYPNLVRRVCHEAPSKEVGSDATCDSHAEASTLLGLFKLPSLALGEGGASPGLRQPKGLRNNFTPPSRHLKPTCRQILADQSPSGTSPRRVAVWSSGGEAQEPPRRIRQRLLRQR